MISELGSEGRIGVCQYVQGQSRSDLLGRGVLLKVNLFICSFLYPANLRHALSCGELGTEGEPPCEVEEAGLGTEGAEAGWSGLPWGCPGHRDTHVTCSQLLSGLRNRPGSSAGHVTQASKSAPPAGRISAPAQRASHTFVFPSIKREPVARDSVHGPSLGRSGGRGIGTSVRPSVRVSAP